MNIKQLIEKKSLLEFQTSLFNSSDLSQLIKGISKSSVGNKADPEKSLISTIGKITFKLKRILLWKID